MDWQIIAILVLASLIITILVIDKLRKPSRAISLTNNFNTISELRNRVEFAMLLEMTTDKQANELAAALNTVYGITTVDTHVVDSSISAIAATNDESARNTFRKLKSI